MKKSNFLQLAMIGAVFLFCAFLSGCVSAKTYSPDPSVAENPPGLLADPENCAYLGGPIRAINNRVV